MYTIKQEKNVIINRSFEAYFENYEYVKIKENASIVDRLEL
jgi:hypothetical protein